MGKPQDSQRHRRAAQKRALRRFLLARLVSENRSCTLREIYVLCKCGSEETTQDFLARGLVNEVLQNLVADDKVFLDEEDSYRAVTAEAVEEAVLPSMDDLEDLPDVGGHASGATGTSRAAPTLFEDAEAEERARSRSRAAPRARRPSTQHAGVTLEGLIFAKLSREGPCPESALIDALAERKYQPQSIRVQLEGMRKACIVRRIDNGDWSLVVGPIARPAAEAPALPASPPAPATLELAIPTVVLQERPAPQEEPAQPPAAPPAAPEPDAAPIEAAAAGSAESEAVPAAPADAPRTPAATRRPRKSVGKGTKARKAAQPAKAEIRVRRPSAAGRAAARISAKPRGKLRPPGGKSEPVQHRILAAIAGFCRDVNRAVLAWAIETMDGAFARRRS